MKAMVYFDSFPQHESSANESGMRAPQGDSGTTAMRHEADGRRGDIVSKGPQGPVKLTRAAQLVLQFQESSFQGK